MAYFGQKLNNDLTIVDFDSVIFLLSLPNSMFFATTKDNSTSAIKIALHKDDDGLNIIASFGYFENKVD